MASGVYQIINCKTSDRYIGSCIDFAKRKKKHFKLLKRGDHPNAHLQNAYNKYGNEVFSFEAIEECGLDQLIEIEQKHLDFADKNSLYNIRLIAQSNLGLRASDETKAKMSASAKARGFTDEHKANISKAKKGWAPMKGKAMSEEHKEKLRAANKGKKRSEEARLKMSEAAKNRKTKDGR